MLQKYTSVALRELYIKHLRYRISYDQFTYLTMMMMMMMMVMMMMMMMMMVMMMMMMS